MSAISWMAWGMVVMLALGLLNFWSGTSMPSYVLGPIMIFWGVRGVLVHARGSCWWPTGHKVLFGVAFLLLYLTPFVHWWTELPRSPYMALHAFLFLVTLSALLALLNEFCSRLGASFLHPGFAREARNMVWITLALHSIPLLRLLLIGISVYRNTGAAPYTALIDYLFRMNMALTAICFFAATLPFTSTVVNLCRVRMVLSHALDTTADRRPRHSGLG